MKLSDTLRISASKRSLPKKPELLVIPDATTNRDFPSVAAGLLAAVWNIPVADFNTNPENQEERLSGGDYSIGFTTPSRSAAELLRLATLVQAKQGNAAWATANGPIDIQCCYPFLRSAPCFSYDAPFDDTLPFPAYEKFDTFETIRLKWRDGVWFYPLMTSLGCPFGCKYCASRRRQVHCRSVEDCISELKTAQQKWDIKKFVIIDDCFNAYPERAKAFASAVTPLGMQWMAGNGLRADRFDGELGRLMRKSGCHWASFGVESVDDTILSTIGKEETFLQIAEAVTTAARIFDHVNAFLILGLPGSTFESDRSGILWAQKLKLGVHASFYVPFDQGMQTDCLFDRPQGRPLPEAYDSELQLQLYQMINR